MELWFNEVQDGSVILGCKTRSVLHHEKTPFQELVVLDTETFGRMLVLDNIIQTTVRDEFIYHEMITHVALNTHPRPEKILVIGGGDGGVVRELLKHPAVKGVTLVEIDRRVVEVSQKFLPEISFALTDSRVNVIFDDGEKYIRCREDVFDLIIVDSSDPVGPNKALFSAEFYHSLSKSLRRDGMFVAQTESPFYNQEIIPGIFRAIAAIFPVTRMYLASIPTYQGGIWSFTIGSLKYDPLKDVQGFPGYHTRYYTPSLHRAAFVLPAYVKKLIAGTPEEKE